MTSSETGALHELLAKDAIRDALLRYCRGEDRLDGASTESAFHSDATVDYGSEGEAVRRPIAGYVDFAHSQLARSTGSSHQIANVLIDVRDNHAVSEAYVTARIWYQVAAEIVQQVYVGRYLDRWSRRGDTWAIDHRDFICDLSYSLRTDNRTGGLPARGRRGPADASHELFEDTSATE